MIETPGIYKDYKSNPMQLPQEMKSNRGDRLKELHKSQFHTALKVANTGFSVIMLFEHNPIVNNTLTILKSSLSRALYYNDVALAGEHSIIVCKSLNNLRKKISSKDLAEVTNKTAKILYYFHKKIACNVINILSTTLSIKEHYNQYKKEKKEELIHPKRNYKIGKIHLKKSLLSLAKIITELALLSISTTAFIVKIAAFKFVCFGLFCTKILLELSLNKVKWDIHNTLQHHIYPLTDYNTNRNASLL